MEDLMLRIKIFHGTVDTESMLIIGAAIVVFCAVMLGIAAVQKTGYNFAVVSACGIVLGTLIFVLAKSGMADKAMTAFIFPSGVLSITVSLYLLNIPRRCSQSVTAVYMSSAFKSKNGTGFYAPVFDYTYNGKRYIERSAEMYSYKEMKHLAAGDKTEIFIDPSKPEICVLKRKYRVLYFVFAALGAAAVVLAVLALITNTVDITVI